MDYADLPVLTVLLVLLLGSGMVSGAEAAFFSLHWQRLESARSDGLTRLLRLLLGQPARLLLVILIVNNLLNVAFFALASFWAAMGGDGGGGDRTLRTTLISLGALAALVVLGEIVPKVLAAARPWTCARLLAVPMYTITTLMAPLCRLIEALLGPWLAPTQERSLGPQISGDELRLVIEHSRAHGVVSELVGDRLSEIVDLGEILARDSMSHRLDCPSVGEDADREQIIAALRQRPGPHIMVMDQGGNCVGLLATQDLLRPGPPLRRLRKPLPIPANAQLAQVLALFAQRHSGVGVVVDEYGGTLGLLSLAHLANELLGPGRSHDLPTRDEVEHLSDGRWLVPGDLPLSAWTPLLNPADTSGCRTIAGFLARHLGTVPIEGDRLLYRNLVFLVRHVDGHRIRQVEISQLSAQEARRMTNGSVG